MAWLRRSAIRCSVTRPSLRYPTLCLMAVFPEAPRPVPEASLLVHRRLIQSHAEAESHAVQDLLNLVQRLAAEVLRFEHLGLGLLHQLANRADVRVLEAVVGPYRQFQLFHALVEILVERSRTGLLGCRLGGFPGILKVDEDVQVIANQ